MKKMYIYFLFAIMAITFWACSKKSSDSTTGDLASNIVGTYTGTITSSGTTLPGSMVITEVSSTNVNMQLFSNGTLMYNMPGVVVSAGSNGIVNLVQSTYLFSGSVNGKSLDCYISTLHFVGTKS
jgi:hypothetical protein